MVNMGTKISNLTKCAAVLICSTLLLGSCSDNSTNIIKKQQFEIDVYVAGRADGNAVYWKNGISHLLSDGGIANSIDVFNGDVYVAGQTDNDGDGYTDNDAVYWKNGTLHKLTDHGNAVSIDVSDGDVYVAGQSDNSAVYWENGTLHKLTDNGKATSISVDNGVVYVTGWKNSNDFVERDGAKFYTRIPMYWKNGIPHKMANDHGNFTELPQSIYVSNGDVYVAGTEYHLTFAGTGKPVYWKNGTRHILGARRGGTATSIFLDGEDIYIAGRINSLKNSGYWKNGTFHQLMDGYSSNSIVVFDGDVYVSGQEDTSFDVPKNAVYWKNGNKHRLTEGEPESTATSICVTKTKIK